MAQHEFEKVTVESHGNVAVLKLNDPGALNAVSMEMLKGLRQAMDHVEKAENGYRCLIMTGTGRGFCAGANLQGGAGSSEFNPEARDAGAALEREYHPFLRRLKTLRMPFVTAVNGPAAGVGMSFALMGDLILASKTAYFMQTFRRIGLVPDGGSTWLLPRLVGMARAKELSLLGEKLSAETALSWGLINRVYDENALLDEAMKTARDLAAGPTVALSLIRKLYWESPDNSYEEQLNLERWSQKEAGRTSDFTEGVAAFLQKRPAKFEGK